jgi:hypothetical protein
LTKPLSDPPGFYGVTGRIVFDDGANGRVPPDKPVAVVTFDRGAPGASLVCAGEGSPDWCPRGR